MTTRFKFTERNPQPLVDLHLVERMQLIDWWTDKFFPWTKCEACCLRLALFLSTQEKTFLMGSRNTEQIFFKICSCSTPTNPSSLLQETLLPCGLNKPKIHSFVLERQHGLVGQEYANNEGPSESSKNKFW